MEAIWDKILKGLAAVGGAIMGAYGGWSMMLSVLVAVMAVDYVSGLMVAISNKSMKTQSGGLSSRAGFLGLMKKAMVMLVVLLATLLDNALGTDALVFQSATICFYVANEGVSILENAALLGLPVPQVIKKALDELKDKDNKADK